MIRAALLLVWLGLAMAPLAAAAQGVPLPVPQADLSPSDRVEIQGVIRQQLDAFRRDDAPAAYRFAAPNVQAVFPSAEGFMAMVRRAYPQVYRPLDAEFSELALRDNELVQEVELVGPDGQPVLALYTMVRGPGGAWVIAGCALIPSARVGA